LLSQNVEAAGPAGVSEQVRSVPSGEVVQVRLTDGRIVKGKLLSANGSTLQLLERGDHEPVTIEYVEVIAVKRPSRKDRIIDWALIGIMLGATAISIAIAGTVY
jgi:hypothetical protein